MENRPRLKASEVIITRRAMKKLPRESRNVIENSDLVHLRRVIVDKTAPPDAITEAAGDYYKKCPELIPALERLEKLVQEEKEEK